MLFITCRSVMKAFRLRDRAEVTAMIDETTTSIEIGMSSVSSSVNALTRSRLIRKAFTPGLLLPPTSSR